MKLTKDALFAAALSFATIFIPPAAKANTNAAAAEKCEDLFNDECDVTVPASIPAEKQNLFEMCASKALESAGTGHNTAYVQRSESGNSYVDTYIIGNKSAAGGRAEMFEGGTGFMANNNGKTTFMAIFKNAYKVKESMEFMGPTGQSILDATESELEKDEKAFTAMVNTYADCVVKHKYDATVKPMQTEKVSFTPPSLDKN